MNIGVCTCVMAFLIYSVSADALPWLKRPVNSSCPVSPLDMWNIWSTQASPTVAAYLHEEGERGIGGRWLKIDGARSIPSSVLTSLHGPAFLQGPTDAGIFWRWFFLVVKMLYICRVRSIISCTKHNFCTCTSKYLTQVQHFSFNVVFFGHFFLFVFVYKHF